LKNKFILDKFGNIVQKFQFVFTELIEKTMDFIVTTPDRKKSVAIVQSSYIPWKGYFDLINIVDEFILYDDVQYT